MASSGDLAKTGYNFAGWDIDGIIYQPGDTYTWSDDSGNGVVTAKAAWWIDGSKVMPPTAVSGLTYNGGDQTLISAGSTTASDATMKYSLTANGDYSTELPQATNAGSYDVYYCVEDNSGNVIYGPASVTATIGKATVNVTAAAKSKTYGDADPELTYTYSPTLIAGNEFAGELSRESGENAGDHAITQGTLSAGDNYDINFTGANLTIGKATLTVTANAASKTYGTTDPTFTYEASGFKNGDTTSVLGGSLSRTAGESVGTYAMTVGSLTAGGNYNISFTPANLTITKASLTVTAKPKTIQYGDAPANDGVTYTGLANGDTEGSLGTVAYAYNAASDGSGSAYAAGGAVGGYYIIPSGLSSDNYDITYAPGALTVKQREVTITAGNASGAYGVAPDTNSFTHSITSGTLATGDALTVSYTCGATASSAAGSTHDIVPSVTAVKHDGTTDVTSNYRFTYGNGTYTVGKANAVVTDPTPLVSVYNGSQQALLTTGASTTGGKVYYSLTNNGSDWSESVPTAKDAGTYTVYYKVEGGSNFFDVAPKQVEAVISKRTVTLTWSDTELTYNGSSQAPKCTAGNLGSGTCTVTVTGQRKDVGTSYTATASALSDPDNYQLPTTGLTQSFSISPKEVSLNWTNDSLTYDGSEQAPTAAIASGNVVTGDDCTVTVGGGKKDACAAVGVGSYEATATLGGTSSGNYVIKADDEKHNFTIAQKEVVLTWPRTNSFEYDGTSKSYQVESVDTEITGETLQVALYKDSAPNTYRATDAGTYTSTATTLSSTDASANPLNYKLPADPSHEWTITGAHNTASVTIAGWTYGDSPNAPTVTAAFGKSTAVIEYATAEAGPYSSAVPTDAGDYWVRATIAETDDYDEATATASFTIAQREVGLTWDATSFVYKGEPQGPAATATGLVGTDTCTVTVTGKKTNVGTGYTATATALSNKNYKLPSNVTCTFQITQKQLTVKAKDNTITYGDAPADDGVTYDGFVGADDASSLSGTLAYTFGYTQYGDARTYAGAITPKGLTSGNYAIVYQSGDLTVEPREVTLVWSAPSSFDYTGEAIIWPEPSVGNTVNGDALTAVWKTAAADAAGAYKATKVDAYTPEVDHLAGVGTTNANNYKLPTNAKGSWRIAKAANAMTVTIAGWTYGKTASEPVVTVKFGNANDASIAYYSDEDCMEPVTELDSNGKPKNVGDYWVKATLAGSDNYLAAEAKCKFSITKANITVTAKDLMTVRGEPAYKIADSAGKPQKFKLKDADADEVYAYDVAGDLASGDDAGSFVDYIKLACDVPVDRSSGNTTTTGGYGITVTASTHPNYTITSVGGSYTVTRALANVTSSGWTGIYDGTDTGKQITVDVTHATSDGSAVADGSVKVYYGTSSFETSLGLTEDQIKALAVADVSSDDFKEAWIALSAKLSGGSYADASPKYSAAGSHTVYFMIVSDQVTPDVIFGSKDVVINKAQLTVTAGNASITYGDDAPVATDITLAYSGFQGSDTAATAVDATNLEYDFDGYAAGSDIGTYAITPEGLSADNYDIVYVPGTLTVGKRTVTLTWPDEYELTYNGESQTYGPPTVGNLFTGDAGAITATCSGNEKADAGDYTAAVTGLRGDKAGNYALPTTAADLQHAWKITPAAVTVKAKAAEVVYGDALAGNGIECDGLKGSDTESSLGAPSYTYTYTRYADVGTGSYELTPAGLSSPNYTITYRPGTLTVKKREVTLDWPTPADFDYTGSALTYGQPELGNVVNDDDVSIGGYEGNAGTLGGTYTAEVTSLAGGKAANYALPDPASHEWKIKAAPNTATVTMADWTYGDAPASPEVQADHGADTATFAYFTDEACTRQVTGSALDASGKPRNAGDYWVKATIAATGSYDGAEAKDSFTIEQRPATVTALLQAVAVGGSIKTGAGQVTFEGAAAGDSLAAVTLTASSTAAVTESGTITPSVAKVANAGADVTDNYDIAYVPAKLIVAAGATATDEKVIYVIHKDIWMTVDEAGAIIALGTAGRDERLIEMSDGHALWIASGDPIDVRVKEDGGFVAVVGTYELVLKANPEVGVTAHVVSVAATDPTTGVTVYANDAEPSADLLRKAKAGDAGAVAELIALAGATAVDRNGNAVPVTGVDLSAADPDKPGTYKAVYSTAAGASAAANVTLKSSGSDDPEEQLDDLIKEAEDLLDDIDPDDPDLTDEQKKLLDEIEAAKKVLNDPNATPEQLRAAAERLASATAAFKAAGGSSATKPDSSRKAASPATGDAVPVALLAATALASACALAFSWRRRESAPPGKHARK